MPITTYFSSLLHFLQSIIKDNTDNFLLLLIFSCKYFICDVDGDDGGDHRNLEDGRMSLHSFLGLCDHVDVERRIRSVTTKMLEVSIDGVFC